MPSQALRHANLLFISKYSLLNNITTYQDRTASQLFRFVHNEGEYVDRKDHWDTNGKEKLKEFWKYFRLDVGCDLTLSANAIINSSS